MNILNVSFTNIHGEKRNVPKKGQLSVSNGINLNSLEKSSLNVNEDRQALKLSFSFKADYKPDVATISLEGEILLLETEENAKEMIETWEETKNVGKEKTEKLLNAIMNNCNLNVLLLSRELNLPSPIKPMNLSMKK